MRNNRFFRKASVCAAAVMLLCGAACSKKNQTPAKLNISGYRSRLLFEDDFTADILPHWHLEGNGTAQISADGRLNVRENPGSEGAMIWLDKYFSDSFMIEYEVELPLTNGVQIVHFCADSRPDADFFTESAGRGRTGRLQDYSQGGLQSYQIAYHCYTPDGRHEDSSRLRKNPGSILLARISPDPCSQNRSYLINIAKTGNRIQFFVDKEQIHDTRDRGGFGDIYSAGRIGFWMHGDPENFTAYFSSVRVYKLIPE